MKYSTLLAASLLIGCSGSTTDEVPVVVEPVPVPVVVEPVPVASTLSLSFAPTKAFRFTWVAVPSATSYKLKEAITNGSGYTLVKETTATSFDHVVPLYNRVNAKYVLESCNVVGCTDSAEVFTSTRVAQMVDSIGYFKASNTESFDRFGQSVSLSADGNTLAVSARQKTSHNTTIGEGAVYVFIRTGVAWSQQAYLKASNAGGGDRFGRSVSLSADGNTLAVGSDFEISAFDLESSAFGGAVYTFARSGTAWSQEAYLKASNADSHDRFGQSVSLSADGNTLAVSAPKEDSNATGINGDQTNDGAYGAGAVYVFTRHSFGWSQQAYIKASNTDQSGEFGQSDEFGHSVVLSADGGTLAVGTYQENSNATGINGDQTNNSAPNAGAVYVFTRNGAVWSQQAYLKASNTESFSEFGYSVSLSADGTTLAVGSMWEGSSATGINGDQDNNKAPNAGAVYVFTRTGVAWSQQAYLKASNTESLDNFGISVSLSADGNTLAVGADGEDSNATGINGDQTNNRTLSSGAVYTFARSAATWSQQSYIKASNTDTNDEFGHSVVLSADGGTLAVSAFNEDSNAIGVNADKDNNDAEGAGAVYVY